MRAQTKAFLKLNATHEHQFAPMSSGAGNAGSDMSSRIPIRTHSRHPPTAPGRAWRRSCKLANANHGDPITAGCACKIPAAVVLTDAPTPIRSAV